MVDSVATRQALGTGLSKAYKDLQNALKLEGILMPQNKRLLELLEVFITGFRPPSETTYEELLQYGEDAVEVLAGDRDCRDLKESGLEGISDLCNRVQECLEECLKFLHGVVKPLQDDALAELMQVVKNSKRTLPHGPGSTSSLLPHRVKGEGSIPPVTCLANSSKETASYVVAEKFSSSRPNSIALPLTWDEMSVVVRGIRVIDDTWKELVRKFPSDMWPKSYLKQSRDRWLTADLVKAVLQGQHSGPLNRNDLTSLNSLAQSLRPTKPQVFHSLEELNAIARGQTRGNPVDQLVEPKAVWDRFTAGVDAIKIIVRCDAAAVFTLRAEYSSDDSEPSYTASYTGLSLSVLPQGSLIETCSPSWTGSVNMPSERFSTFINDLKSRHGFQTSHMNETYTVTSTLAASISKLR
jgi:hypothetical protein